MAEPSVAFGPVPSRRLGRSLGINNIPPKVCTYSCVYCQLGRTTRMRVQRGAFYEPAKVFLDVRNQVERARAAGKLSITSPSCRTGSRRWMPGSAVRSDS